MERRGTSVSKGHSLTSVSMGQLNVDKNSFWWSRFAHLHVWALQKMSRMTFMSREGFLLICFHQLRQICWPEFHWVLGQSTMQDFWQMRTKEDPYQIFLSKLVIPPVYALFITFCRRHCNSLTLLQDHFSFPKSCVWGLEMKEDTGSSGRWWSAAIPVVAPVPG